MRPADIIRKALAEAGSLDTEDPRIKAAARRMRDAGEIRIETYSANSVGRARLVVREGYAITPATSSKPAGVTREAIKEHLGGIEPEAVSERTRARAIREIVRARRK